MPGTRWLALTLTLIGCGSAQPIATETPRAPEPPPAVAIRSAPELAVRFRPHQRAGNVWMTGVEAQARLYARPFLRMRIDDEGAAHALTFDEPTAEAAPCGDHWLFLSAGGTLAHAPQFLAPLTTLGRQRSRQRLVAAPGARVLVVGDTLELVSCAEETPTVGTLGMAMVREVHSTAARVTVSTLDGVWTRAWDEEAWSAVDVGSGAEHAVVTDRAATYARSADRIVEVLDDGSLRPVRALPEPATSPSPSLPAVSPGDEDLVRQAEARLLRMDMAMDLPGGASYVGARADAESGFVVAPDGSSQHIAVPAYTHPFVWNDTPYRVVGNRLYGFVSHGGEVRLELAATLPNDAGPLITAEPPGVILFGVESMEACEAACLYDTATSSAVDLRLPDTPFQTIQSAAGRVLDIRDGVRVYGPVGEEPRPLPAPFANEDGVLDFDGRVLLLRASPDGAVRLHTFDGEAGEIALPPGATRLRVAPDFWVAAGSDTNAIWSSGDRGAHWARVAGPRVTMPVAGEPVGRCVVQRCGFGPIEVAPASFVAAAPETPLAVGPADDEPAARERVTLSCADQGATTPAEPGDNPFMRFDGGRVYWRGVDERGTYAARATAPAGRSCWALRQRREGALLLCSAPGETQTEHRAAIFRVGFGARPAAVFEPATSSMRSEALLLESGEGVIAGVGSPRDRQVRVVAWDSRARRTHERFVYTRFELPQPSPAWVGGPAFVQVARDGRQAEVVLLGGSRARLDIPSEAPLCTGAPAADAQRYRVYDGRFVSQHPLARSLYGANWGLEFVEFDVSGGEACVRTLGSTISPFATLHAATDGVARGLYWAGAELAVVECRMP